MIELRRRAIRPIAIGMLCRMNQDAREDYLKSADYIKNGNIYQNGRNYDEKLHVGDVDIFYCVNDQAFNSKDLIELVPVRFHTDGDYGYHSFLIAKKKRMKVVMKRKEFHIIENPSEIPNLSLLEYHIKDSAKKNKFDLTRWKNPRTGR